MGLGLRLRSAPLKRGLLKRPIPCDELLSLFAENLYKATAEFAMGYGKDWVQAIPIDEPVELACTQPGVVEVSAKTSSAGPGYHMWLVEALDAVAGQLGLSWMSEDDEYLDETGYFVNRNKDSLYREMHAFLRGLAEAVAEYGAGQGPTRISLGFSDTFTTRGELHTSLGPQSVEWLREVANDPARGAEFWPWYEPGVAAGQRGVAAALMWTDVRWRRPANDSESTLLRRIDAWLNAASNVRKDLPWSEWDEIRSFLSLPSLKIEFQTPARIGYRRNDVLVRHGSWSLQVPGSMSHNVTEEGTLEMENEVLWVGLTTYRGNPEMGLPELPGFKKDVHPMLGECTVKVEEATEAGDLLQSMLLRGDKMAQVTFTGGTGTLPLMREIWKTIAVS